MSTVRRFMTHLCTYHFNPVAQLRHDGDLRGGGFPDQSIDKEALALSASLRIGFLYLKPQLKPFLARNWVPEIENLLWN